VFEVEAAPVAVVDEIAQDRRAGDIALFMNVLQQRKPGNALLTQSSERFLELRLDGLSARRDVPLPGEPLTTKALDR
jgi:hypothetical protein